MNCINLAIHGELNPNSNAIAIDQLALEQNLYHLFRASAQEHGDLNENYLSARQQLEIST